MESVCGAAAGAGVWDGELVAIALSPLACIALVTEVGRLPPAPACDAASPGPVELGLLGLPSPTKLDIRESSSLRLSARFGVGEAS